ncbi:MAG: hypothetical protein NT164_05880 [Verrucomicrobiae bacterium]|nr:hypothetical protein [Verrucomicrobiae bacterium]
MNKASASSSSNNATVVASASTTSSVESSWSSKFCSFFGWRVRQTNSQPGNEERARVAATAQEKTPITSSFWSGAKITIPRANYEATQITTVARQLVSRYAFQGSQDQAKELLSSLSGLEGKGTLVLRQAKEGAALQYKNFWFAPSEAEKTATNLYIYDLLQNAYPGITPAQLNLLKNSFSEYLSSAPNDQNLGKNFKSLFATNNNENLQSLDNVLPSLPSSETKEIPPSISLISYLITKGVKIDASKPIGQGAFGKVYAASIGYKEYVYKEEKEKCVFIASPTSKFHRTGDIAASRLNDLPHFAKTAVFILEIKEPTELEKKFYVPTEQVKAFTQNLSLGTSVALLGQLMEKAPGQELRKLVAPESRELPLDGSKHFHTISEQLFSFLEKTYARNFIHRDIKTENLMFDADPQSPTYQKLTVIDAGLGGVFGKRSKMLNGAITTPKNNNPLYSTKLAGTPDTLAPEVLNRKAYGSEVDFHSAGATLIELLDPKGFEQAVATFFDRKKVDVIAGKKIPTTTAEYLRILGANGKLANALLKDSSMQKTIDLFFGVASATPENREAAFQALKNHMEEVVRPALQQQ